MLFRSILAHYLAMLSGKGGQQIADGLLTSPACLDLLLADGFILLVTGSEILEGGLFFQV